MEYQSIATGVTNKNRIILDESALMPRFLQDNHLKRCEAEAERILSAINRLSMGDPSENLFIHGPSGSGKSAIVKTAISKGENRHLLCIYANCWRYSTSMSIYAKIADAFGEPVSRRGRASDEVFDRIVGLMKESKRPVLLVLDEVDALVRYDDARILHNIARVDEEHVLFGIIAISDNENLLSKLSQKTRDILGFTKIEIPPYTRDELLDLLKNRVSIGLRPGACDDSIIEEIADIGAVADGSARFALKTLWRAARSSEDKGLDSITKEEWERIKASLELDGAGLSHEEIAIIELLEDGPICSTRLYSLFHRTIPKTKRQIRNYLHTMEEKGIIETQYVRGKYNYGSTIVQLSGGWKDE
jgi:archaeal cell division control protein 6